MFDASCCSRHLPWNMVALERRWTTHRSNSGLNGAEDDVGVSFLWRQARGLRWNPNSASARQGVRAEVLHGEGGLVTDEKGSRTKWQDAAKDPRCFQWLSSWQSHLKSCL